MKKNKHIIEQEVQKTLDSVDKIQRVEGNPFLYTRLQERLRQEQEGKSVTIRTRVPVFQLAMVGFLLFINGFALIQSDYFDQGNAETTASNLDEFAAEYALTTGDAEDLDYLSWTE